MKESIPYQPPELPSSQFALAAQLCQYIQSVRGVDQSIYSGELLMTQWENDGAYVGFETKQRNRPTPQEVPLETAVTIALPTLQGSFFIEGDWIHQSFGRMRYESLDGQSDLQDAVLVLSDIMSTDSDPRHLFELPYRSLDLASYRTDISHLSGRVANKNDKKPHWNIVATHKQNQREPERICVERLLDTWCQMQWCDNGSIVANSQNGSTPRVDTMLKHLWDEAAACIAEETHEGRPLHPMHQLQQLCDLNLDSVLARAGEHDWA